MRIKKTLFCIGMWCIASVLTTACGGPGYMVSTNAPVSISPEVATVVFYRPSSFGAAYTSAVYDVTTEKTDFLGGVKGRGKVVARVSPGNHTFMVSGENADFSYATLEAGKLYYIRIQTRMGFGKMRYSLNPIHSDMIENVQAKVDRCKRYEKSDESDAWFEKHKDSIENKRTRYFEKWMTKSEAERPGLLSTDNVPL